MKYIRISGFVVAILLMCNVSFAQDIPVKLVIGGTEKSVQEARSYLKRELRSLGDVTITDNGAIHELSVLILEGYSLGVLCSSVYVTHYWNMNNDTKEVKGEKDIAQYLHHLEHYPSSCTLQEVCSKVIAKFDDAILDGTRIAFKWSREEIEQMESER